MQSNILYDKLLQYSLKLISKKRYAEKQIIEKLNKRFKKIQETSKDEIDEALALPAIDMVLNRLKELKYLDDVAFARDFISDKIRFGNKGRRLLKMELIKKGVKKDDIESGMQKIELNEYQFALDLLGKRDRRWSKKTTIQRKEKAFRLLYSRGYDTDTIYRAINYWYNHVEEEF